MARQLGNWPLVQKADNTTQQTNHFPVDKSLQNILCYPPFRDLSGNDKVIHPLNSGGLMDKQTASQSKG